VTQALAVTHCDYKSTYALIQEILASRPADDCADAWMKWAIATETICRDHGIDLRSILRLGWSMNSIVYATCATWSRLGGTSPRAMFFDAVNRIREHRTRD
jgi:hypothetical protein